MQTTCHGHQGAAVILVVDDDLQMLGFLREVLEKDGYEVEAFNEPYQALRFCGQEVPNLIISEVRMAEMSGFDFLHTYRTRHAARKTPFVFLSALSRPEQISRGLDKGADDYLTKPIDPGLLCAKVRSHLRQANAFGLRVTRGNLHQLPFTALIRQCERSGLTGILEVFGEDIDVSLPFVAGLTAASRRVLGTRPAGRFASMPVAPSPPGGGSFELSRIGYRRCGPEDLVVQQTPFQLPASELPVEGIATLPDPPPPLSLPLVSAVAPPAEGTDPGVAAPGGMLSGLEVGGKLFQVQTEIIEGIPRRIVTVATYRGKALVKRDRECPRWQNREELQRQMAEQHEKVESEVRCRVEVIFAINTAARTALPPTLDELFSRAGSGCGDLASHLWEERPTSGW